GLGVMTKGPAAAVLPASIFVIYFALNRELRRLRKLMLPYGALIVAAMVSPWYLAIYEQHGWHYIATFILNDNLSRYTQPVFGPRRSIFFYVRVLFGDMFPWSLFLIAVLWIVARRWLRTSSIVARLRRQPLPAEAPPRSAHQAAADKPNPRLQGLCLIWVAVIVIFFSLSQNKEDLYILPVYPAVAALVGVFLAQALQRDAASLQARWARWTAALLGLVIAATGAGVLYIFGHSLSDYQFGGARLLAFITMGGGLTALAMA